MDGAFEMSDTKFIKRYRLTKELARQLITELTPHIPATRRSDGLDIETKVLIALAFYATGSYQTIVGDCRKHCVSQPSVSKALRQVTMALNKPAIINKYLSFPFQQHEREQVKREFYSKFRMPGVLGCIDGTHVAIVCPAVNEERYFNRKGYHSLNVLIICDANLNILCVDASYPGSTHDSVVWANHPLCAYVERLHTISGEDLYLLESSHPPVTVSPSGSFRGTWMSTRRGRPFQAYRGIKYAEAPVGSLRFQPPVPILHYPSTVDATEDGPVCPQPAAKGTPVDEDCLVINVYTPSNNRNESLPVIVFIHAGGFYSMSGRSVIAGPHYLLDRDVVFVTLNYRIGSLGFLALGTADAPGNVGFKDQVAALRWIQRNIAFFGGDPNSVTISGTSAGSLSVMVHMISPMSKGLFHRAISMSGSPTSKVPSPSSRMDLAMKQAKICNCPTTSPEAIYQCLKTKTWKEIAGSLLGFFEFGYDPLSLFRPVVEPDFGQERFLSIEPMDAIRQGIMHTVPYIISQTRDEFFWKAFTVLKNDSLLQAMDQEWDRIAPISFILPRNETSDRLQKLRQAYFGDRRIVNDSWTTDRLGKLYGDSITAFPVHRLATLMCRHSKHPVWYYEFDYIGEHSWYEDSVTKKPTGVAHHDDMLYLFSLSFRFPTIEVSKSEDSKMVDKMTAMWYNFAKFGDPNPNPDTPEIPSFNWPPMTPTKRKYLKLGKEFSIHENLNEDRFKIWEELYPIEY